VSNSADSLNESNPPSDSKTSKRELAPLEVNGITAVTLGTAIWSIATVIMVLMRDQLTDAGRGHWIAIGVAGIILGLLGIRYTKRRVARIERNQ
jgi:hypothetical protein